MILRTKFTPRLIAGLEGWWDASVPSSVTLNASTVSLVEDQSGNGRDATQSTASNQPTYSNTQNGLRVLTFDGATQHLRGPWELTLTGQTTFAVVSATNSAATTSEFGRPFSQTTTTDGTPTGTPNNDFNIAGHYFPLYRTGFVASFSSWRSTGGRATVGFTYGSWGVWSSTYSSTTISNALNNGTPMTFAGTALNTTFDMFGIGGGTYTSAAAAGFFTGSIGEVISYSRGLSAEERAAVSQYLREKWATP